MRKSSMMTGFVLTATLVAVAGVGTLAQAPAAGAKKPLTLEEYDAAMKSVQPLYTSLGRNTMMMNLPAGAMDAEQLIPIFQDVLFYWESGNPADALPFAKGILAALQEYQKAARAGDQTAANTARAAITPQCMGCHMLHRDRLPDGTSRMK